jgi:hypothetical protein
MVMCELGKFEKWVQVPLLAPLMNIKSINTQMNILGVISFLGIVTTIMYDSPQYFVGAGVFMLICLFSYLEK